MAAMVIVVAMWLPCGCHVAAMSTKVAVGSNFGVQQTQLTRQTCYI